MMANQDINKSLDTGHAIPRFSMQQHHQQSPGLQLKGMSNNPFFAIMTRVHTNNYNDGLFATLFLYFFYKAEAPNLSYTIVLLITYCKQNIKHLNLVWFSECFVWKKHLWHLISTHFLSLTIPIAREPYFTAGFNPTHCLVALQLPRPSTGEHICPHNQFIRPIKQQETNWSKGLKELWLHNLLL